MVLELSPLLELLLLDAGSAKLMLKPTPISEDFQDTLFLLLNAKPPLRDSAVKFLFRMLAPFLARCATQLLVKSATPWPVKSATLSPRMFPKLCALPTLWKDASHLPSPSLQLSAIPSQSPPATQSRSRFPVKNRSVFLSPEKSATLCPAKNVTLWPDKCATPSPNKSATQLNRRFPVRSAPPLTPKLMLLPPFPFTPLPLLL